MKLLQRKIDEIDIEESAVKSIRLPLDYEYRKLMLRMELTMTLTGGSSDPTYRAEAETGLIQRIEIIANGKDTIKSYSMSELRALNLFRMHTAPQISKAAISGAADYLIRAACVINFVMPDGYNPVDTLLRSRNLSTLQLKITFGTLTANVITGGDRAATVKSGSKIYVTSRESFGLPADAPVNLNKEFSQQNEVTGASQKLDLNVAVGNIIKSIMLRATDAGVPEDDIIESVQLFSGTEVFLELDRDDLRFINKLDRELETLPAGYYLINTTPDGGLITEALDARAMSQLKMRITASKGTGATYVDWTTQEIIFPQAPVSAA